MGIICEIRSWLAITNNIIIILYTLVLLVGSAHAQESRRINDTKELEEALGQLLRHPWALLYSDEEASDFIIYDSDEETITRQSVEDFSRGCHSAAPGAQGWTAVFTFNSCVRVFSDYDCWGESLAMYPREALPEAPTPIPWNVSNPRFQRAKSVGPCLSNEFESAAIYKGAEPHLFARKDGSSELQIPDLLKIELFPKFIVFSPSPLCYKQGWQRRGNYTSQFCSLRVDGAVKVWQLAARLNASTEPAAEDLLNFHRGKLAQQWERMDKEEGDVMGFFIPPYLSQAFHEAPNMFPQSRRSKERWDKVLESVLNITAFNERERERRKRGVCGGGFSFPCPYFYPMSLECEIDVRAQFYYMNHHPVETNRPDGFYYRIEYSNCSNYCYVVECNRWADKYIENRKIMYGFIWN